MQEEKFDTKNTIQNISFSKINKKNIEQLIQNILPLEQKCINLSSLLKLQKFYFDKNQKYTAFLDSLIIYDKQKNKEMLGLILTSKMGVILHCFTKKISEEVEAIIKNYFLNSSIPQSVMGDKENSQIIEKLIFETLNKKNIHNENYKLLVLKENSKNDLNKKFFKQACENLNANLQILKPNLNDVEKILNLEIAYQIEEVLNTDKNINKNFFRNLLTKYINKKSLYTIKMQNQYMAKASINANGINWLQIGGVYTIPKHRNKGLGAAIIENLINDKKHQNKNFALFVKLKNLPARNMYKKLGFQEYCDFRISYF